MGIYELITHYRDSIHNREYHNFCYRYVHYHSALIQALRDDKGMAILHYVRT